MLCLSGFELHSRWVPLNISRHWELSLQNRSLFPLQYGRLDVLEVKAESVTALSRYFGMKFLSLEIR